ncbi:MAG: hypothetical protein AMK71_06960 [Nitrospira bacterium SG8_35_4]|nr:MAG: hypothetical protein AMK71_06960 [Nitrospira bacterium SG8_35_4]
MQLYQDQSRLLFKNTSNEVNFQSGHCFGIYQEIPDRWSHDEEYYDCTDLKIPPFLQKRIANIFTKYRGLASENSF